MERENLPDALPAWLAAAITVLILLTLVGGYLTSLRLIVDPSPSTTTPNQRDALYFGLHGATLVVAMVSGGVVGFIHNRRAFAFSVLFLAVILVVMFATQLITFELACSGHNDIIRHWQC